MGDLSPIVDPNVTPPADLSLGIQRLPTTPTGNNQTGGSGQSRGPLTSTPARSAVVPQSPKSNASQAAFERINDLLNETGPPSPDSLYQPTWNRATSTPKGNYRDLNTSDDDLDRSVLISGQPPPNYDRVRPAPNSNSNPNATPARNTTPNRGRNGTPSPGRNPNLSGSGVPEYVVVPGDRTFTPNPNRTPEGNPWPYQNISPGIGTFGNAPRGPPLRSPRFGTPPGNSNSAPSPGFGKYSIPSEVGTSYETSDLSDLSDLTPSDIPFGSQPQDGTFVIPNSPPQDGTFDVPNPNVSHGFPNVSSIPPNASLPVGVGNFPNASNASSVSNAPPFEGTQVLPQDEFLSNLELYLDEILKDFEAGMEAELPDRIQEIVERLVDEMASEDMLRAVLDAILPQLFERALVEMTRNDVHTALHDTFGPNVIDTVFPLIALGKVSCSASCDCNEAKNEAFPGLPPGTVCKANSPCLDSQGRPLAYGDDPCAEFGYPGIQIPLDGGCGGGSDDIFMEDLDDEAFDEDGGRGCPCMRR